MVALGLAVVGLALWVRLAPTDAVAWHRMPDAGHRGEMVRIDTGADGLARLRDIAQATPRTRPLAGSVESGMMTWVTRSRLMGFPDYTTARQDGETLLIWARQRYGTDDFGVNAARLDHWREALVSETQ
tara:strand:- start:94623 stop:95009 length:387 start_codon:yes stop_codon:yes gene_type:complete